MNPAVDITPLLDRVAKPAQYVGGELNARRKSWREAATTFALCFPDAYEIGMSNLAMGVLYEQVNDHTPHLCDRAFTPFPDLADLMREAGLPLFGWETRRPLADFDMLGFSLSYESGNTNVLEMLDLADIPLESHERGPNDPLILGGGSALINPEPMADFFDLIAIGEGEEMLPRLLDALAGFDRDRPDWRRAFLLHCATEMPGFYVPSLYRPRYAGHQFVGHERLHADAPARIERQLVDLDAVPAPSRPVVPLTEVVHDRVAVELDRGCARACRFCQAGYIYRPVRRRSAKGVAAAIDQCLASTGQSDVSLLSLNAVDYDGLDALIGEVQDSTPDYLQVSIPSTRVESFNVDIARALQRGGKRGGSLTFAPEAATTRMRKVINKEITDEDLAEHLRDGICAGLPHDQALLYDRTAHRDAGRCARDCAPGQPRDGRRAPPSWAQGEGQRHRIDLHSQALHPVPMASAGPARGHPRQAAGLLRDRARPQRASDVARHRGKPGGGPAGGRRPARGARDSRRLGPRLPLRWMDGALQARRLVRRRGGRGRRPG